MASNKWDRFIGLEDESEDEQEMQDVAYEEFECDEDPTWSPEEIEDAYKKLKEDDTKMQNLLHFNMLALSILWEVIWA